MSWVAPLIEMSPPTPYTSCGSGRSTRTTVTNQTFVSGSGLAWRKRTSGRPTKWIAPGAGAAALRFGGGAVRGCGGGAAELPQPAASAAIAASPPAAGARAAMPLQRDARRGGAPAPAAAPGRGWPGRRPRRPGRGRPRAGDVRSVASDALDERGGAKPAAAAHRHEAELLVLVLELVQQRREQARAGRAERMAERHRAPAWVHAIHVGLVLARPGRDDRRERLVDLDEVDVADRHRVAVEDLLRRRDRAGEHRHRVDADGRLVDDPRPRAHAELIGLLARHEQHGGGAVGDLRRVARRDAAVLLEGRLEARERLERGVRANALVGDVGRAVDLERHRLALEAALLGRLGGEMVRAPPQPGELRARG